MEVALTARTAPDTLVVMKHVIIKCASLLIRTVSRGLSKTSSAGLMVGILLFSVSSGQSTRLHAADLPANITGSHEVATVFEVDPDPSTRKGYRIPALLSSSNGTLLAFSERRVGFRDHAENDIVLRRSQDGGRTWSPLQVIADRGGDSLNDPCAVQLESGRILLRYTHFPKGVHANTSKHTVIADPGYDGPKNVRIWLTFSDDSGDTWTEPRDVTRRMRREQAVSLGSPGAGLQITRGMHKGRILLPNYEVYHLGGGKRKTANSVSISDDNGETWRLSDIVNEPLPATENFGDEAQLVELSDGALLMSARDEPHGSYRKLTVSQDGGQTWSVHRIATDLVTPPCMSSLLRYSWPEGQQSGMILHSLPHTKDSRSNGQILVSRDDGRSWTVLETITSGSFAYSSMALLQGGDVGCLYETDDYRRIVFARFPARLFTSDTRYQLVFSTRRWDGDYFTSDVPGQEGRTESTGSIYRINPDGTGLTEIVDLGGRTEYPVPAPDGRWLYFQSPVTGRSQIYRCLRDGSGVVNLTEGNPLGAEWSEAFGVTLSADGQQLLYTVHNGQTGQVVIAAADGSGPRFVAPQLGYTYMASLSPAGDRIVFSGPARGYRLLIADLPDGEPRLLTPDHPDSYAPVFTPDGRTILFFRRDGDLYRIDSDGKNLRRLTEGNNYVEFRLSPKDQHGSTDGPQLSPDGQTVAYMVLRDGVANIHLTGMDGRGSRQVTFRDTSCGRVRWSPDGQQLAFISFVGKYPQLFVTDLQGKALRQLTELDEAVYFPQWDTAPH